MNGMAEKKVEIVWTLEIKKRWKKNFNKTNNQVNSNRRKKEKKWKSVKPLILTVLRWWRISTYFDLIYIWLMTSIRVTVVLECVSYV